MPKTKNDATFHLRLPQAQLGRIATLARQHGKSMGFVARLALTAGLERAQIALDSEEGCSQDAKS